MTKEFLSNFYKHINDSITEYKVMYSEYILSLVRDIEKTGLFEYVMYPNLTNENALDILSRIFPRYSNIINVSDIVCLPNTRVIEFTIGNRLFAVSLPDTNFYKNYASNVKFEDISTSPIRIDQLSIIFYEISEGFELRYLHKLTSFPDNTTNSFTECLEESLKGSAIKNVEMD